MNKQSLSLSILLMLALMTLTACTNPLAASNATVGAAVKLPEQAPAATGTPVPAPVSGASSDLLAAYQGTLETLYSAVSPSVVNIRVVQKAAAQDPSGSVLPGFPFFNMPQGHPPVQQFQSALGSGFVWDNQGHIVTNNHVVAGADKIEVRFSDGTTVPATLVGTDPDSDLAVIKVEHSAAELKPVSVGDSTTVKVGELAIAIGNPFGLENTMTTGIISAVGRSLPAGENSGQSYTIPDVIQTDAAINPGNSGGVLVDSQGQVIGVTSAIESPVRANAGVGFAIPSAIVKNVVPALIKDGKYVHTWLGISGTTLRPELTAAMKLESRQRGALVEEILPDSPAAKAGLMGSATSVSIEGQTVKVGGDVITAIDGQTVTGMDDLIAYLAQSTQVGQKAKLTILRDGKEQSLDVTLAARPSAEERGAQQNSSRGVRLGIAGLSVDEAIARAMGLQGDQRGVLVEQVQPGSLADTAGLRAGSKTDTLNGQRVTLGGDVITALNGQPVSSIEELKAGLAQLTAGDELSLTILRDGKEVQVSIKSGG
jgi:S1-C subfamily serine protease